MKQKEDNRTVDFIGLKGMGGGRPRTGQAKSAAQRQSEYRERLRERGREIISVDLPLECVEALRKHVQFKDMTLGAAVEKIVRDRLLRKR